jgi:hypothetical protein
MIHIVHTIKMFERTGTSTIDVRLGQGCPENGKEHTRMGYQPSIGPAPRSSDRAAENIEREDRVYCGCKVQMQDMVPCSLTLHKRGRETSQGAANLAGLNDRRW